jgi:hypothetical protein
MVAAIVALGAASRACRAVAGGRGEISLEEARIFLEFNSTDNDLGVQVFLDGEAWNRLEIVDSRGDRILGITAGGGLGELGLTELFFESDEPSPEEVLSVFRAGKYGFEGETVEGVGLESEARLSHRLPPAPKILAPSFPGEVLDRTHTIIQWEAIPGIAGFEVIVENEDLGAEMTVPLSAATTRLHVPEEFLDPDTEYKVEVLAVGSNGNKTIAEREFITGQ